MLVLFGVDGVVLKDVLCALGGLGGVLKVYWGFRGRFNWYLVRLEGGGGGIFGVLWRFDVYWALRGVRVALGAFGRRCWGRFGGSWGRFMGCLGVLGAFGGCWGHFWGCWTRNVKQALQSVWI